jgi:hypothetical protein
MACGKSQQFTQSAFDFKQALSTLQGVLKVKVGLWKFQRFTTESTKTTENLCFSLCSTCPGRRCRGPWALPEGHRDGVW